MTNTTFDPWSTASTTERIQLAGHWINKSLYERAAKRVDDVVRTGGRTFVVVGNDKFRDTYPQYEVTWQRDGSYECACFALSHGESRARNLCSHVVAVMIYRENLGYVSVVSDGGSTSHPSELPFELDGNGNSGGDGSVRGDNEPVADRRFVVAPSITDDMWREWDMEHLPSKFQEIRPHQWDAVEEALEHYRRGIEVVYMDAPTGCLSGETTIGINRGGNGRQVDLATLVKMFNGGERVGGKGSRRTWDLTIPTKVQCAPDDVMRLGDLEAAIESGVKITWRVRTRYGREIRATGNHPFLTPTGYRDLAIIRPGDEVLVLDGQGNRSLGLKPDYRIVNNLTAHPYAGRRGVNPDKGGWSVPQHRLVVEAEMNSIDYEVFIKRLRDDDNRGLRFLDPGLHVHHKDENPHNNALENLEVLTQTQHNLQHDTMNHVMYHIGVDVVTSIDDPREEMTYDLRMVDEPHNFIANEFVVHNSGKSLIAELIRRRIQRRAFYVCHSKTLQAQFLSDFPYAKLLMGRSNYPTLNGDRDVTCADCTKNGPDDDCLWCDDVWGCPYQVAKTKAIGSKLAVLNTAYFLTEFNYVGQVGKTRELGIIDECDTLEGELMGFVEFYISSRMTGKLGLQPPKEGSHYKTLSAWLVDEFKPKLHEYQKTIRGDDLRTIRERMSCARLMTDVLRIEQQVEQDETLGNWVRDNRRDAFVLKPVTVGDYGDKTVWAHAEKWLCMSATIISADELSESCGLTGGQGEGESGKRWELVRVPMTFPVANRQIIVAPVADMSKKGKERGDWEHAVTALRNICDRHPDERILVHTVSYELAQHLCTGLSRSHERGAIDRPVYTYRESGSRDLTLAKFRRDERSVLVAASMDRGVDLAGDDCRVIVVAKVPFPNLGDAQIGKRMRMPGGQQWYAVQAVRKLVQMTGRAVRSSEDWCVTYVLDQQMTSNVLKKHRGLLPKWWTDALVMDFPIRELLR